MHSLVGGRSIGDDIFKLEHGVHMISGTPGNINCLFEFFCIYRESIRYD